MKVIETALAGVVILEPKVFGDQRGFFLETYRDDLLHELGVDAPFVQDNHSRSQRGVLRGLHYQLVQPQAKLVRVTRGQVFDVAVDVRTGSPTFGQWASCILDDIDHRLFFVPAGFAHGFCVMSEEADFVYKCSDYYHPESEHGIAWDDPAIAIDWPLQEVLLSERDRANPVLAQQTNLPQYG